MEIITGNGIKKIQPKQTSTHAEELSNKIKNAYALWLADDSVLEDYKDIELFSPMILVRVFIYIPYDNPVLNAAKGTAAEEKLILDLMFATPYAKVLAVGKGCEYNVKAGDIIKLQDHLTMTVKNPQYEAWLNNDMNKSNAQKIGDQPPRMLQPILGQYKYIFVKDGLKQDLNWDDKATLLFPQSFFTCKINTEV